MPAINGIYGVFPQNCQNLWLFGGKNAYRPTDPRRPWPVALLGT